MTDYDVIIVGGRAAGSTLAARLGRQGARVLLLERAAVPSLPAASSPIIYASTMRLLDEIGADEADYARKTPRIYEMYAENPYFKAKIPIPRSSDGRAYAYAVDRARFDGALWHTAARTPGVTARDGFAVGDLLMDGDRVTGVVGRAVAKDAPEERLTAALVVGADGRYSLVARRAGAQTRDEHTDCPTSLYYAYWKGVQPHVDDDGISVPTSVAYGSTQQTGVGFLMMDSADDTTVVVIEGQSRLLNFPAGKVQESYAETIRTHPRIAARLRDAEQVTTVRGIRDVGNFYRTPGGHGWALVGDAYLQEDPLDGQGIYNAVFGAKKLAQAVGAWRRNEKSWRQALDGYDEAMRVETYYMYQMTLERVRANLYTAPPDGAAGAMMLMAARWMMEDPQTLDYLGRLIARTEPPNLLVLRGAPVMAGALVRGGLRSLFKRGPFKLVPPF